MDTDSTRISIKVVPGASRSEIVGLVGDALKIRVAAPPEKGAANRAVSKLLATALAVPSRQIRVVAGGTSQRKIVSVEGLGGDAVLRRLAVAGVIVDERIFAQRLVRDRPAN